MDVRKLIRNKRSRLRRGLRPRVLDLFAGCGGLSLGFQRAGFDIVGAVEHDPVAIQTHARNFSGTTHPHFAAHSEPRDITEVEPASLLDSLHLRGNPENAIDVIIGGPPCQAFARVGRAKLREIDQHPEAFTHDPRSNLYLRYLQYVQELMPLALLIENVPDVMNFAGQNLAEEICENLKQIGYRAGYTLLNAAYYGVPQMRDRMFLIAFRDELDLQVQFPAPTHWVDLPPGYTGSRHVALRVLIENGHRLDLRQLPLPGLEPAEQGFIDPPSPDPQLLPAVTVENALADLPPIMAQQLHDAGQLKRGTRRFVELTPYRDDVEPTRFAADMRNWPRFKNKQGVRDHVIRSLPRDYRIFARMQPGDQYPQAHALAESLCEEERRRRQITVDSAEHELLKSAMIPPYDPGKFPNKWRKLEADLPSRTLMAHIGKDTYSHIHYDSQQARTISVREAARLQSFPDGFEFAGTMNPAFRQIGNAVPPLLACALAKTIRRQLNKARAAKRGSRRTRTVATA